MRAESNNLSPKGHDNTGFLSGFVESFVENPDDGLNGNCIVHYENEHSDYKMIVNLVDGIRDGIAMILHNDIPFIRLVYSDGVLTGPVEKIDERGHLRMRGYLENGVENGMFTEYTDMVMTWRGYYMNGKRYSEVVKSHHLKGFYEEWEVESGELLSIAEYDVFVHEKSGCCFVYYGGTMDHVILNGVSQEEMEQYMASHYDESVRSKLPSHMPSHSYTSMQYEFNEASLILFDESEGAEYGAWIEENRVYNMRRTADVTLVIEANLDNHEMSVYENNVVTNGAKNGVIDLDVSGKRWEGGVKNEMPFGYGTLYDENGKKEYEGFMMNGLKTCHGKEYTKAERIEYYGCFYEGNRFGFGVLYNRDECADCIGLWKDNEPFSKESVTSNHSKSLSFPSNSCNTMESPLLFHWLHSLKKLEIGDNSFEKVRFVEVDGLRDLESVVIGQRCFTYAKSKWDLAKSERTDGICRLLNCPKLKSILLGDYSFADYSTFDLSNLPSLQFIQLGQHSFHHIPSLLVSGVSNCNS